VIVNGGSAVRAGRQGATATIPLTSTPEGFADDVGRFFGPHKGVGCAFHSARYRSMWRMRARTVSKEPRRIDLRVRMLNQASTRFSQEAPFG